MSVFYAKDLSTIESDGLLGLSPKSDYVSQGNTEPMHLLVNEMKVDGIISKAMFGLYLTDTASQSKIHFGGYDESIVQQAIEENQIQITDDFDGIYWMKINSKYHWQVILFEAKIGNTSVTLEKPQVGEKSVIFDSGSSLIYIPTKEFLAITS